ncbi:hypothetical protein AVDCRST_MAG94-5851, partial [uncultured Leptolyngbya sp.]
PLANPIRRLFAGNAESPSRGVNGLHLRLMGLMSRSKEMRCTLASARTFPPSESPGWTIHFIERESRYWVDAQAGQKTTELFEQGTQKAWEWAKAADFIRWFTDWSLD